MTNGDRRCKLRQMSRGPSQARLGREIAGRYRVVRWLGEGGHGAVYEAVDSRSDRRVAVKVVKPEHASDVAYSRFEAEANATRRVDHPRVARILDVGEDSGDAFVVMELVDGPTLRAFRSPGETLSPAVLADIFVPLVDAVAAVHRAGLVHRDLKPSNVGLVIGDSGRPSPKLLDFGMAKVIEGDAHTTTSGRILGTPHYMSPEQALGEPTNDPRVDVWALGVMLYECLEGERPYGGASATAVLMNVLRLEPRALSRQNRDSALGKVVARALERDADRRFPNGEAMHDALVRAFADGVPSRRTGSSMRAGTLSVVGAIALGAIGILVWRFASGESMTAHPRSVPEARGWTGAPSAPLERSPAAVLPFDDERASAPPPSPTSAPEPERRTPRPRFITAARAAADEAREGATEPSRPSAPTETPPQEPDDAPPPPSNPVASPPRTPGLLRQF